MVIKRSRTYLKNFIYLSLIAVLFVGFITPQDVYADTGVERIRSCTSAGAVEGLESGLGSNDGIIRSDDLVVDFGNEVCLTQLSALYATVKWRINQMNKICATGSAPRVLPSPFQDTLDITKATLNNARSPNAACTTAISAAGLAVAAFVGAIELTYLTADDVFDEAKICGDGWIKPNSDQYDISTAGSKQNVLNAIKVSMQKLEQGETLDPEEAFNLETNKNYRQWYYDGIEVSDNPYGYYMKYVNSDVDVDADVDVSNPYNSNNPYNPSNPVNANGSSDADISGADFGADTCKDPTASEDDYPRQKYYLKGSGIGNFNCEKYLIQEGQNDPITNTVISAKRLLDFKRAYQCCQERRKNYICIDYADKQIFCKAGKKCSFYHPTIPAPITFEITRENNNLICAQTYSLCPYNFSIAGGSNKCDYFRDGVQTSKGWDMLTAEELTEIENDYTKNCAGKSEIRNNDCTLNEKAGKCRNYCQLLRHCTTVDTSNYAYSSSIASPYFSSACMNFTGDSRNQTTYNGGILFGSQRHFSAPIAQCFKETMSNVFYNKFGHSRCLSSDESPSSEGICASGNYQTYKTDTGPFYQQGNIVSDNSFFQKIQDGLRLIIKLVLTLAVMVYGFNILLGGGGIKKSDLIMFVLKIGLVMYFAVGTAWQDAFFDGVYNVSGELSQIVFKIDVSPVEQQRDGCQFGNITTANATIISSASTSYPEGKEYLALWDTLDCKIARYLGFGPEASAANIAMLIVSSLLSGPYGLYFSLSLMFFGFFFIATTIRALHIFLSSTMAIIVLVFISPIIIPTVLFKKTSNIFKGWVSNLIGFCLQPVILFAYIAIFITIMDKTLIGSAKFYGTGPNKTISCSQYCADSNGNKVSTQLDLTCDVQQDPSCNANVDEECDDPGNKFIDPMDDSFACLVNINDFGKFPGFEIVGVSIPILKNIFTGNVTEKVLTILKAAIVMYILCQFMDQIPGIASYIVGGGGLPSGNGVMQRATGMMNKTIGISAAIQKRARRGTGQFGNAVRDRAVSMIREQK